MGALREQMMCPASLPCPVACQELLEGEGIAAMPFLEHRWMLLSRQICPPKQRIDSENVQYLYISE